MLESIEQEFRKKYPIDGYSWEMSISPYVCCGCSADIMTGEIALFGRDVYCSKCGVDMYNSFNVSEEVVEQNVDSIKEKTFSPPSQEYAPPVWAIMSDGSCYFCGHGMCSHRESKNG